MCLGSRIFPSADSLVLMDRTVGEVWEFTDMLCCLCLLPQSYVFTYFRGRFFMIAGDFDQVGFT